MTEYVTTREQCQAQISGVCPGCGGLIEPIETVDNANHPTFWSGCMACSKFSEGVDPKVFLVARRLVENRCLRPYSHLSQGDFQYLESQTNGATSIVLAVLYEANAEGLEWPHSRED
jgi:hypothetical protein